MSDDDPFEELDEAVEDREGDPFDSLGHPDDGTEGEESGDDETGVPTEEGGSNAGEDADDDAESRSPWGEPLEPDTPDEVRESRAGGASPLDGEGEQPELGEEPAVVGPTDGIQEEPTIDTGQHREGDPFESMGDAFSEMDVEGVDAADVWQRLTSAEARGSVTQEAERAYAEVSKHSYCEQCEYFSEPPEIDCSNEGTEIVEFLDMDTVRVVDCPIVVERQDLEE